MTHRVVLHLRSGAVLEGTPNEVSATELTQLKGVLTDLLSSSGEWQVNLEIADGWVIVPKASVDWIEVREVGR